MFLVSNFASLHMPYLRDDVLLLSASDAVVPQGDVDFRPWKIGYVRDGLFVRIPTTLSDLAVECSPVLSNLTDDRVRLSFVGGELIPKSSHDFRLYIKDGPSLDNLGPLQEVQGFSGKSGFVTGEFWGYASIFGDFWLGMLGTNPSRFDIGLDTITRFVPVDDRVGQFLITGLKDDVERTALVSPFLLKVQDVLVHGQHIYKSSILGDRVIHAIKLGGIEDRDLRFDTYELVDSELSLRAFDRDLAPPSFGQKVINFGVAAAAHVAAGLQHADHETILARLAICEKCSFRTEQWTCLHPECGCNLHKKVEWAEQRCPLNPPKWAAVAAPKGGTPCCGQ